MAVVVVVRSRRSCRGSCFVVIAVLNLLSMLTMATMVIVLTMMMVVVVMWRQQPEAVF